MNKTIVEQLAKCTQYDLDCLNERSNREPVAAHRGDVFSFKPQHNPNEASQESGLGNDGAGPLFDMITAVATCDEITEINDHTDNPVLIGVSSDKKRLRRPQN